MVITPSWLRWPGYAGRAARLAVNPCCGPVAPAGVTLVGEFFLFFPKYRPERILAGEIERKLV
jgi:hypothetical protein